MAPSAQKPAASPGSVLLFHIESADGCFDHHEQNPLDVAELRQFNSLLAPQSSFESKLRRDVSRFTEKVMREEGRLDIVVLAVKLVGVGYKVSIRRAVGGGAGQECFRNLSYEFLLVGSNDQDFRDSIELVVDPKFREQFRLVQQTQRYSQYMDLLPAAFVGHQTRLTALVKKLAYEMEAAFSETGITMPPWRQSSSMLSKWKPLKSKDKEIGLEGEGTVSKIGGDSPRDHLSLCSSRTSSSCSDMSPDRGRFLTDGLQRQASIPKRIQSGFCVNSPTCDIIPENQVFHGDGKQPTRELCAVCALSAEQKERTNRSGRALRSGGGMNMILGEFETEKTERSLGLAKIRTVRPVGCR